MCQNNSHNSIKLLLHYGAHINIQNEINWTSLHFAATHNSYDAVKILLHHRADTTIKNIYDKLAEDMSANPRMKALFAQAKVDRAKTNQDRKNVIQELNDKFKRYN